MDAELHTQYARILREQSKWGAFNWKTSPDGTPRPHFGPSSAGKSDRELYEKVRKSARDDRQPQPQQRRWTALGSFVGDLMQREILLAERHYEKFTGKQPRFKFARTDRNEPMFEHFTKVMHEIEHDGEKFAIFGLGDGILEYVTEDGEVIRIGLEVKSKQGSYADTSPARMREPKRDHFLQTVCYSDMYALDYFFIVYVNTAKKAWNMTDEEREKSPDFRVFGVEITDADRNEVKSKFARVTKAAREGKAPAVELDSWLFCEYKGVIATALNDEELAAVKNQVRLAMRSGLPDWKKQKYYDAYEEIKALRGEEASA
ncbi:MAG: hypothetical protein ACQEV7_07630 [Bacillota bacterium]